MTLTDTRIRNAKPKDKFYRLADGGGMYLEITPSGGKWWRLKYRIDGREKRLSLGTYPTVSLKDAREKREAARKLLSDGIDPSENRKAIKLSRTQQSTNSFEVIAREWFATKSKTWAASHGDKVIRRLERDIFPWLGSRPISVIAPSELLATVRRIEERDAIETARRALLNCSQVFRYAVGTGRASRDPVPDLRGALRPTKAIHRATITDPKAISELLNAIDNYHGSFITKCALRLAPLVFVRPGELRAAEWSEINLDNAEWNIRAERMKMREPHLVPLSTQAIAILREIHPLTGGGKYVFPSELTGARSMSENTVLFALRRMGFSKETITGHGFRAMARTILDEVLQERPDYIEHQLAHAVRDPNGRAYNRTSHLPERRKMMQRWADYLDDLKVNKFESETKITSN